MKDKTELIFRDAPIPKAVLTNVIPSVISMLMVLVYNLADTFFISQTKNPIMIAAVSVATPAFLLFMAVGMLFGVGGTSLISRMLGAGDREKAKSTAAFCFWTATAIGVISAAAVIIFARPICYMIGASDESVGYAVQYLQILAVSIPGMIISNAFSNIIRSEGKAGVAMAGSIVGNLVNIVLDPIMILTLNWTVAGAALATTLGNLVSAGMYISHLCSKKSMLSINPKHYTLDRRVVAGVLSIGIPASLNSLLMSVSNIAINSFMGEHGDLAQAGLGVAMKVNMIAVMLLIGVGAGVQPLLGYCFGARNEKRYKGVLKFSLALAIGMSAVMTAICYFGAAPLARAFLEDPQTFDFAFAFSRMLIMSGPVLGCLFVFINAIQAMGAAVPALVLSVSRQGLAYFPILFIIHAVSNTPQSLAMAQPLTDYVATAVALIIFLVSYKVYFKKNRIEE